MAYHCQYFIKPVQRRVNKIEQPSRRQYHNTETSGTTFIKRDISITTTQSKRFAYG
jgi:hypothetical protein